MDWKTQYEHLQQYVKQLELENRKLRRRLGLPSNFSDAKSQTLNSQTPANLHQAVNQNSSSTEKIRLFRSPFRGREDVYARRWHSFKSGKSGYAPVSNGYFQPKNPQSARSFQPLTDRIIYMHLCGSDPYGRDVVGIYPISEGDTCFFLAIDFDDGEWQDNIAAVHQVCMEWSIPCAIERSRSGEGAHLWIFFSEPVACTTARQLGSLLLMVAMERSSKLTFNSYDRMFPCQDSLPKGGFGNLIALPLQGQARKHGNSLFVDEAFSPYADQWSFLAQIQKLSLLDTKNILQLHQQNILGNLCGAEPNQKPWEKSKACKLTAEDFHDTQRIIQANMLFLSQDQLSSRARNQLIRLAAFCNPDFYKAQAMRLPVYNKPRIISTAEELDGYLALPRGCKSQLIKLLEDANVPYEITDKTCAGQPLSVHFQGTLRPEQVPAVNALLDHEIGVLAATTAFGKTVIAASLISHRQVNTLIIVHTQALLNQWKRSLEDFLAFDSTLPEQPKLRSRKQSASLIGQIGGGKNTAKGLVDIAIVRSLISDNQVKDLVKNYGMVIVDECHHASAASFERVLKEVNAHYVYGLTATPTRRDGHHPIVHLQCGLIRYQVDAKSQAEKRNFTHTVIPRFTTLTQPLHRDKAWTIADIYRAIQQDETRNAQIIADTIDAISHGRTPIILTERYEHAQILCQMLSRKIKQTILLSGRNSTKEKREVLEKITHIPPNEPLALVATGRYIGEGFDLPRLDTLMLAMPISWKGTLAQYAGRLHRDYANKQEVLIYDYVDLRIPMLERMYQKRLAGYSAIGYGIRSEPASTASSTISGNRIFTQADYLDVFMNDIQYAKRSITIASPYLQSGQVKRFLSWLPPKVNVQVITADSNCFKPETEEKIQTALMALAEKGIQIRRVAKECQRCAIIDDQLLWYGGINFLGYEHYNNGNSNNGNGTMRLFSSELAKELLDLF